MIEIGKVQTLEVVREKDFGVYLNDSADSQEDGVLLPKKQVPAQTQIGDRIEVFIYKDSMDRLIATTNRPKLVLGEIGKLTVTDTNKMGAFMDWGLEKDLLLPFKEQTRQLKKGDTCFVAVYLDKTKRLCATMKVYTYLSNESPYEKNSQVSGTIYQINKLGLFVAVDNKYYGMIPAKDIYETYRIGQEIRAKVETVREDGKLDLTLRKKAYKQMDADSVKVLEVIDSFGGVLPFGESASPEVIKREFAMSKNGFKRALGHLYKEHVIEIKDNCIRHIRQEDTEE